GASGDGAGPAAPWLEPRPRDFTRGAVRWRAVNGGVPPPRDDLIATIRFGAPGTAMPGFVSLSDAEIDQLIGVVAAFTPETFSARSTSRGHARVTAGDRERGAALWTKYGCGSCHGDGARGDGPAAAT